MPACLSAESGYKNGMPLRVGMLSVAHMHSYGYAAGLKHHPGAELAGVWHDEPAQRAAFVSQFATPEYATIDALLENVDAVIICSENRRHVAHIEAAFAAGKPVLCEKPIVGAEDEAAYLAENLLGKGWLMTAFPCRYSPAFGRLKERVGELGAIRAICATNRGRCPGGWFIEPEKSGGGAMIDHVVHVTDLLRAMLGEEVVRVQAQTGHNRYGQAWDDTAMLTLEFASGVFATLDSSWSRPDHYKTWGDVTMNVVGEQGVVEMDMFGQTLDVWASGSHRLAGYGSDLDALLVDDFVSAVVDGREPPITGFDGLQASRVALAGYRSAAERRVVKL